QLEPDEGDPAMPETKEVLGRLSRRLAIVDADGHHTGVVLGRKLGDHGEATTSRLSQEHRPVGDTVDTEAVNDGVPKGGGTPIRVPLGQRNEDEAGAVPLRCLCQTTQEL